MFVLSYLEQDYDDCRYKLIGVFKNISSVCKKISELSQPIELHRTKLYNLEHTNRNVLNQFIEKNEQCFKKDVTYTKVCKVVEEIIRNYGWNSKEGISQEVKDKFLDFFDPEHTWFTSAKNLSVSLWTNLKLMPNIDFAVYERSCFVIEEKELGD